MRIWPVVPEKSDYDEQYALRIAVGKFFAKVLLVPADDMNLGKIERIRRIHTARRRTKIKDELLVTFVDVAYRDYIMSHTKNLAAFPVQEGRPGTRLDYPEFLAKDFRLLETFGARMRSRLGEGFKRCVKFDDDQMRLYLDIKLPESPEWMSITPEIAQEVKLEDDKKKTDSIKRIIHANGTSALDSLFKQIRQTTAGGKPTTSNNNAPHHNQSDFPTQR